jgi:hypothetical protein
MTAPETIFGDVAIVQHDEQLLDIRALFFFPISSVVRYP